jgi:ABC-type nitrate/sulfonate/bicarbonate transport system substrate-binding protein
VTKVSRQNKITDFLALEFSPEDMALWADELGINEYLPSPTRISPRDYANALVKEATRKGIINELFNLVQERAPAFEIQIDQLRAASIRDARPSPIRRKTGLIVIGMGVLLIAILLSVLLFYNRVEHRPRIAIAKWMGYAPFYVASQHGKLNSWILLDEGLGQSRESRRNLILGKTVEAYTGTIEETINDLEREAQYRANPSLVLFMTRSEGGDAIIARNGSNINSIKDLKGKRIGAWAGGTAYFLLTYRLAADGVNLNDVDFGHVENPKDLISGLAESRFDAVATWSPWVEQALNYGYTIAKTEPNSPPDIYDILFIPDPNFLANKRESIFELFDAWDYGVTRIQEGGNEIDQELSAWLGLSPQQVSFARANVRFYKLRDNFTQINWDKQITLVRDQVKSAGLIRGGESGRLATNPQLAKDYLSSR